MSINNIRHYMAAFTILAIITLAGCQSSSTPAGSADAEATADRRLAPQRVDIRGSVVSSRYDQGQVILEVENYAPSPNSRYTRAYVLVLPTAQMVGPDGQAISVSELRQGQQVAILLRGGGEGNLVGMGVARKVWVENNF
ncbi:hypothetical protein [Pontibacter rugosus]|uniref:Lipoprotein n=1 Tax=Pontibacter rugosus TaxID=1745966 RepID=A0ABW3SNC3_9BACT